MPPARSVTADNGSMVTTMVNAVAWISEPLHAILLILLLATSLYHSSLGVQVVVEDYVHHGPTKVISLVLVNFIHVALAVAGIYSIVRLSVGGQG